MSTTSTHIPFEGVVFDVSDCATMEQAAAKVPAFQAEISGGPIYDCEGNEQERYKNVLVNGEPTSYNVGSDFGFVQPSDTIKMCDQLIEEVGARPATLAATEEGIVFQAELSLPQATFSVTRSDGREDKFDARVSIVDANNGTKSFMPALVLVQMFCLNQLRSMLTSGKLMQAKYRHSRFVRERLPGARAFVRDAIEAVQAERGMLQRLEDTVLPKEQFFEFAAQLFTGEDKAPEALKKVAAIHDKGGRGATILERKFETLATLWVHGTGNSGKTALDALSAVTEWQTWGGRADSDDALLARVTGKAQGNRIQRTANAGLVDDLLAGHGWSETDHKLSGDQSVGQAGPDVVQSRTNEAERMELVDELLTNDERRSVERRLQSNMNGSSYHLVNRASKLLVQRAQVATAA